MRQKNLVLGFWVLVWMALVPAIAAHPWFSFGSAAFADDDDDGGGDDDDDGGDDDGDDDGDDGNDTPDGRGGGAPSVGRDGDDNRGEAVRPRSGAARRDAAPRTGRTNSRRTTQQVQLPDFAPEIVVSDLAQDDLSTLIAEGFVLIDRRTVTTLAGTLDRLRAPGGVSLPEARDRVRQLPSGSDADLNHFYRSSQSPASLDVAPPDCDHENCAAWQMIGWTDNTYGNCPVTTPIGLIDTGINPDHDSLAQGDLTVLPRPLPAGTSEVMPSAAVHGTAVASLLIGDQDLRVPGLVPMASVVAVDVFNRFAGDERADVVSLVEGLDLLAARQVRLYNLSLSGPPNSVLTRMLDRMTNEPGLDAVIVSAAGNGGPAADPAWPGAHPKVISVTAVDTRGRVFSRAQRGEHVDLAAPGVNVLAATSVRGARAKTGTSFAVPFVTAAAALLLSRPGPVLGVDVRSTLFATARDIGAVGRDAVYGYGLLDATALCRDGGE